MSIYRGNFGIMEVESSKVHKMYKWSIKVCFRIEKLILFYIYITINVLVIIIVIIIDCFNKNIMITINIEIEQVLSKRSSLS